MRVAICAAYEMDVFYHAIDDVGFVDAETLVFPEVAVDDAFADGLLHDCSGVEAIPSRNSSGATLIKKSFFICPMVCHFAGVKSGVEE